MNHIAAFYIEPSIYTQIKKYRSFFLSLSNDPKAIIDYTKKLLIHPIEARRIGVRFDYKKTIRNQIDYSSVNDIINDPKVNEILQKESINIQTDPSQRGILSCDHHVLFFISICRLKNIASRARCGYATYLVEGKYQPHWICEILNGNNKWISIDPEQKKYKFEKDDFLTAGETWLRWKQGEIQMKQINPDYRSGDNGLKYRLLNDINGIMKNEFLHYDWLLRASGVTPPRIFKSRMELLSEDDNNLLDEIAMHSFDASKNLKELIQLYSSYVTEKNLRQQFAPNKSLQLTP